jgi:serine/threonine protein kinase
MKEVFAKGTIKYGNENREKQVFAIMVLETLTGGELYYHIKKCEKFSLATSRLFFTQLASAISHMHKSGYCHRDLKPWNIMVSSDLKSLKIIDFGYATPIGLKELEQSSKYLRSKLSCTANYMAPELYQSMITTSLANSDVFALGVILVNFLSGGYPFDSVFEGD